MATDSIMGLFQTPEQYQLAQQQAQMEQARAFAAQDPMQRAVASQYFAGGQLGRALGGEDPMLKLQTARQQILRSVDQTDPQSLAQAAQALNQAGDVQGARALAQAAQEIALKQSQVTKNLREGNAAMLTSDQRNFAQARQEGYTGSFNQWLTEQNKSKATNIGLSPEIKLTNQELDWRKQFLTENKPVIEQAANVQQALGLLQQSQQSPFADAAFANTVVSAFGGDKQKSKAEIDRLVKAGSLDERVANTVKGFFEGTTSAKTKEDQLKVLTAVDKVLEQRYNTSAKAWSSRLSQAKVNPEMVVPGYGETVGAIPAATGAKLPPEGTRLRNKATGKIEIVRNGQLVPE